MTTRQSKTQGSDIIDNTYHSIFISYFVCFLLLPNVTTQQNHNKLKAHRQIGECRFCMKGLCAYELKKAAKTYSRNLIEKTKKATDYSIKK